MEKKKKKGSYGKVLGTCVVGGCIVALLALFGGNFDIGWPLGGGGGGNGNGGQTNGGNGYTNQDTYHDPTYTNDEEAPGYDDQNQNGQNDGEVELVIRVVGNTIYHVDTEVELNDLVGLLERYNRPGARWELHDEQAIMETFELVEMLMRENMINYDVR